MNQISRSVSLLAAVVLFLMMVVTFLDVGGRQLFSRPLHGATEMNEIGLMLITFLILPIASARRSHIKVDLLEGMFPKWLHHVQLLVTAVLGLGLFGLLSFRLWRNGMRALGYGDVTPELELPTGYLLIIMSILSAITALGFVASLFIKPQPPKSEIPS